jgi:hypothetical protein
MKGYMKGASAELLENKINAPNKTSMTIKGASHHFFSWRINNSDCLRTCHTITFYRPAPRAQSQMRQYHLQEMQAVAITKTSRSDN